MFNLKNNSYLYAQCLDNKGGAEYLRVSNDSSEIIRLTDEKDEFFFVCDSLDSIMSTRKYLKTRSSNVKFYISFSGECVISVEPKTLDKSGRISPVIFIFNFKNLSKINLYKIIDFIKLKMKRELDGDDSYEILSLKRYSNWPGFVFFLYVFLFGRVVK